MRRAFALGLVSCLAWLALGCGDDDTAEGPDCPPTTTGAESTTTVDPRCIEVAESPDESSTTTSVPDQIWEGTVVSVVTTEGAPAGPCGNPTEVSGDVHLVVAPDGSVTGSYDVTGCGVTGPHAEFTGTVTDDGFSFPELIVFTNGEPIPKISPREAEAMLTNMQGPFTTWVTEWHLICVTC
jgi:hypothetical protein